MRYRKLGRTGLKISALGLGSMQFGWTAGEAEAFAIMDTFTEAGGNFIDTADIYSRWAEGNPGGVSERIIGRWMWSRKNRSQIVLATKVRGEMGEGVLMGGLSRRWIFEAVEASLNRLQTDYIDLYQVHWPDLETPIEETLEALTDLVHTGLVRYIGASNFPAWRLVQALWVAEERGLARFDSLQPEYNLAQPVRAGFERESARACEALGVGVLPYSPLAGGFLTGKYRKGAPTPQSARAQGIESRFYSEQNWRTLDTLRGISKNHDLPAGQIALAWLLAQPAVSAPIVGANHHTQLLELLPAADLELSGGELSLLSQVSDQPRARTDV